MTYPNDNNSNDNSSSCFSGSDLAYDALKGCAGGLAADLAVGALVPAALTPPALFASCLGGAAWYATEYLIDSAKCVYDLPDSKSHPISNNETEPLYSPYPNLDELQYGTN
jgi:hypothetical protein